MSYHIIYDKQFIKADDNLFIPMLLSGSNNCFENRPCGRERRSRSWSNDNYFAGEKSIATKEEIEGAITKFRDGLIERNNDTLKKHPDWDVYSDRIFGYFSSISMYGKQATGTTFSMFKNVYAFGMKNAKTVEELAEHNIRVEISISEYLYEEELAKAKKEALPSVIPETTQQLVEAIKKFEDYYKGTKVGFNITFNMHDEALKRMRKKLNTRTKREKAQKEFPFFFVIKIKNKGYFVKNTKYGFKYIFDFDSWVTKKFVDEKKANTFLKKVKERNIANEFEVEKIEKTINLYV